MKCPYCGSENLVWREGQVVCSSCGSVIDRIYDGASFFEPIKPKPATKYTVEKEEIPIYKDVVLDNGAVIRAESLPAIKLIESNELFLIIYDVVNSHPLFRSKTIKTKLAVALYLYDTRLFKKFKRILGMNEKRVLKVLASVKRDEREKLREKIRERAMMAVGSSQQQAF